MKLEMHRNSLFAVLLRSPWWVSVLAAAGVFGLAKLFFSVEIAAFAALPFAVVALYAAWQQLRRPSARRIAATLARLGAMPREEFGAALEAGWRRQGYEVTRGKDGDLELQRGGRLALVGCRRWKAVRTGVEPLRELHAAGRAREANELIYVAAGEVTEQARAFAQENRIQLLHGAELAALVDG